MYTIYTGIALLFFFMAWIWVKSRKAEQPWLFCVYPAVFGPVVCGVLVQTVGFTINAYLPMKTVTDGPYTLVAMRSADGLAGNFVYGSGSLNGTRYYNVMVRNDDGSMSGYVVNGDDTTRIIESSDMRDHGQWVIRTVTHDYSGRWGNWAFGDSYARSYNILTVPINSVVHDFNVR